MTCLSCCDEKEYEEYLNDCYGTVNVCGITFDCGRILRELDNIAFNCAQADEECTCEDEE